MTLIRNALLLYIAGFVAFCGLRLLLAGPVPNDPISGFAYEAALSTQDYAFGKRNIASAKRASAIAPTAVDQKYEQVANIGAATTRFEEDEREARAAVESRDALIQYERRAGLDGRRTLELAIGVAPAEFDGLVDVLKGFGELDRLQIDKTDKTNEYLDLKAKQTSLEKSRDALKELKSRQGDINELINLETRILDLEQQIQALGVNLGDFDEENEFSTVKLFLAEKLAMIGNGPGFIDRLLRAALWTLKYYTLLWVGLAAALVALFVGLKILGMAAGAARLLDSNLAEKNKRA